MRAALTSPARFWALSIVLLACLPESTSAHTIIAGVSGFEGGLLHPLMVPTHVINVIALALLIGQRPSDERSALIAIFAAGLLGAMALVVLAFATDRAETMLLGTAILSGVTLAARARLPFLLVALLAIATGFTLQLDSVPSSIFASETLLALSGAALAALAEVALIAFLAARAEWPWLVIAIRIAGSWIAAIALLMLALSLR